MLDQHTKETLTRVPQDVPVAVRPLVRCPVVCLRHQHHHRHHPHPHHHQSQLSQDPQDLQEEWDLPDQLDLSDPWERPDLQDHPDPRDPQDHPENLLLHHHHPLRVLQCAPILVSHPARPRVALAESKRPRGDATSLARELVITSKFSVRTVLFQWIFFVVFALYK